MKVKGIIIKAYEIDTKGNAKEVEQIIYYKEEREILILEYNNEKAT